MTHKLLLLLGLCILPLNSQSEFDNTFATYYSTSLSSAASVITVQRTTISGSKNIRFIIGYLHCSVACTITLERSGTAASTTSNTIVNLNPANATKRSTTAFAYRSSNVGTGTTINTYNFETPGFLTIELHNFQLNSGTADNLTLRSSSVTGTVSLGLVWREL